MRPTLEDRQRARQRALEWKTFRRNFLYSQNYLASTLGCCRRTVSSIEAATVFFPGVALLRRFRDLRFKHQRMAATQSKQVA
jgi:hypothetical protein